MPSIDIDPGSVGISRQYSHRDDVVQPGIIRVASLENLAKVKMSIRLLRPTRLDENIGTIVGDQIVPGVGREDAGAVVCGSPICAQV